MSEHRARCIVRSWLMSWNIPHEWIDGCLVIDGKSIQYDSELVVGDFDIAMLEMSRILQQCGKDLPAAPRSPQRRRAAKGDILARAMRLTAFSKTPNPGEEVLTKYLPVIRREADRAWRHFSTLNRMLMLEPGDYLSVGLVFATIYLHRYQDLDRESRNGADLTLYLQQEFRRWDKVLHHDLPSIVIDARGWLPEQLIRAPIPGAEVGWSVVGSSGDMAEGDSSNGIDQNYGPSYVMPEYVDPVVEAPDDTDTYLQRQQIARARLSAALLQLDTEKLVATLEETRDNPYLDHDARKLAGDLLKKHLLVSSPPPTC